MFLDAKLRFALLLFLVAPPFGKVLCADDASPEQTHTYKEIPYYVRQLQDTKLEDKRIEFDKIIHDVIVNANLADKRVIKEMDPMIEKVRVATDSGLDRLNISGSAKWLESALNYYQAERLKPVIDVSTGDWVSSQTETKDRRLSITPQKIFLVEGDKATPVATSQSIHEAILSPDNKSVAYFRTINEKGTKAEIHVVSLKHKKDRKIAVVDSCRSLIFSLSGDRLYFQEAAKDAGKMAAVKSVSASGGTVKTLGNAAALETIIGSGRYKGNLVVFLPRVSPLGTGQDICAHLMSPSGEIKGRIKNGPCR